MPLHVSGVPVDATELDILYADPEATDRGEKAWSELAFKLLKTVPVAGLATTAGKKVVPLAKGEDEAGRAFDVQAVKTVNGIRYPSKLAGFDYHNRVPFSDGVVKLEAFVGEKDTRLNVAAHLYDPDARPSKLEIIPAGDPFGKDPLPAWAALQGTDLVIDATAARAEAVVAIRLTDEKGATNVLDVVVTVLAPSAPATPTLVEYVAV